MLGGLAALALAVVAVRAIDGLIPWVVLWSSPHALEIEARTLGFTFGASLVVGTVLGLVPALHVMRRGALSPLARRPSDDAPDRRRLRNGLVVAQVALSMTLLAAAGLFVKSFARLVHVDPGYDYERIALAHIGLSPRRYADGTARAEFFRQLEEVLEERTGRRVLGGALYATLDRLEGKGYVISRMGEPDAKRGGRPKRFIEVTPEGVRALADQRATLLRVWEGLEATLGDA